MSAVSPWQFLLLTEPSVHEVVAATQIVAIEGDGGFDSACKSNGRLVRNHLKSDQSLDELSNHRKPQPEGGSVLQSNILG